MDLSPDYMASFFATSRYLNFASYGPPSRTVLDAVQSLGEASATGAVGSVDALAQDRTRAVEAASRLSGFDPGSVVLIPNTSSGLIQAAFGMSGETVLFCSTDFPANTYPWLRAMEVGRLTARPASAASGPFTPDILRSALTGDITAVALSAVDFRNGYRIDLTTVRDVIGDRLLIVDAIQAFGAATMDWRAADVVVTGGQKWLRAGWGTGFMALSDRALERVKPVLGGWAGVERPNDYDDIAHRAREGAAAFDVSHLSPVNMGAFARALDLVERKGVPAIETAIRDKHALFIRAVDERGLDLLSPRAEADRAGIAVIRNAAGDNATLKRVMEREGFTLTYHGSDRIRVSIHATSDESELGTLAELLGRYHDAG